MTAIVELKNVTKAVSNGMNEEKVILDDVSLEIREHDFITILGGNGAGKSTLFNTIAGTLPVSSGKIYILGEDVTNYSPEKRAKYLSRVFQDPKMGTAPRMTVAENLLVAKFRGCFFFIEARDDNTDLVHNNKPPHLFLDAIVG